MLSAVPPKRNCTKERPSSASISAAMTAPRFMPPYSSGGSTPQKPDSLAFNWSSRSSERSTPGLPGTGADRVRAEHDRLRCRGRHLGDDETRRARVHVGTERAQRDREGAGETLQAHLGGRVVALAAVAERRDAGQADDLAVLLG